MTSLRKRLLRRPQKFLSSNQMLLETVQSFALVEMSVELGTSFFVTNDMFAHKVAVLKGWYK